MHGDLTPRNIGINQEFEIKLLDFGLARETNPKLDRSTNVDIWAAALVALEMLGMKFFMPTGDDEEFTKMIRERGVEKAFDSIWEEKIEPRLDRDIGPLRREDFKDLIKKMLHPNLQQRLRADECLLHPFLRNLSEKFPKNFQQLLTTESDQLKYEAKKNEDQKGQNQLDRDFCLQEAGNQSPFGYHPDSRTRSSQDPFFASLTIPDFLP
ncbi:unnamed protein product, partial [Mesorhabditis belari]|uniref:Protein kinase domain-containing protein n=1 Tax=Mesorhabditis belari TaxID=2138241 RepID=A0AAF3EXT3_9BILA